ncbi:MAG: outer membrane protein assembly factor [Fidelibacterota bacterium]
MNSVTITGNEHISTRTLKQQLQLRAPFLFRHDEFDRRLLKLDAITLKNYYRSNGYLKASVIDSFSIQDDNVDLFFKVHEGRQYFLHGIEITGAQVVSGKKIAAILGLEKNKPFNPIRINTNMPLVDEEYQRHGKLYNRLKLEREIGDSINVYIFIDEGPDVHIALTLINGNNRVDSSYVRREFLFNSGDIYNKNVMDRTKQILLETGFFSSINFAPQPVSGVDTLVQVNVQVKEFEKRGEISLEPGYFEIEWSEGINKLLGFGGYLEWLDRMVFGSTTRFSARGAAVMPTEEGFQYPRFSLEAKLSNQRPFPEWLVPFRVPSQVKLYYQQFKNFGDESGPYIRRLGLEYSNIFRFYKRSSIEFGIQWERFNESKHYSSNQIVQPSQIEQRKLSVDIHLDYRDDPFYPLRGTMLLLSVNSSGGILGGTRTFTKFETDLRQYVTLFNWVTLAGRINGGLITGWNESYENYEKILFEKFYLGGSNTLRAWRPLRRMENIIGGKAYPVGNTVKVLTNLEGRFPLFWRVGGVLFMDGGTIASKTKYVTFSGLTWNYGLGITLGTPFGPIRVDYARAVDDPSIQQLHFGFLYAF